MLESFGIDAADEAVYRMLLNSGPPTSLSTVAEAMHQTPGDAALVIDRLVEIGLVHQEQEYLTAIAPEIALPMLLDRQRTEIAERGKRLSSAQSAIPALLAELGHIHTKLVDHVAVERLVGLDAVRAG